MKKNNQISVGVVIPTYNCGEYIFNCLLSICNQSYPPSEIIVVDDGSTDNTASIVKNFAKKYPKIKYYYQKNSGQSLARNVGAEQLNSEFVAFCDADDTWYPNKLERQMRLFANPKVQFVFSNADIINETEEKYGTQFDMIKPVRGKVYLRLLFGNFINSTTVIMRRTFFKKLGGFDTRKQRKYIEDYDLWLRASLTGEGDFIPQPLVTYLRHPESTSHAALRTAWAALRVLLSQPKRPLLHLLVLFCACFRQTLVVIMYLFRLERLLSRLSWADQNR